jgi:exonuclease SbcD
VRCSFVHFGDVHLGTQQYDSPERLNDFGRAWLFACDYIANARPDFAICAGDLFNRFTINPITFDQAFAGLSRLREAGVPIVDIQGNHDRLRYGEAKSWLESLADQGLLTYLDLDVSSDGVRLRPVGRQRQVGSYVEWAGCRIVGMRYLGASTERVLAELTPALRELPDDGQFRILVAHAGLEGIVPNFNAELSAAAAEQLRGQIDYLALGHLHKLYAVGDFIYNAGSLETWAVNEWAWDRGLLHVEVDTSRHPAISFRRIPVPKRQFCIMRVDVSQYASPQDLLHGCFDQLVQARQGQTEERPVAILTLHGRLRFDQIDLPSNQIEAACREVLSPLVALVREHFDVRDFVTEGGEGEDEPIDRRVLEREILQAHLADDARYAPHAAALAKLAMELKERVLDKAEPPALCETLRRGLAALDAPSAPTEPVDAEPVASGERLP